MGSADRKYVMIYFSKMEMTSAAITGCVAYVKHTGPGPLSIIEGPNDKNDLKCFFYIVVAQKRIIVNT